ncbi:MAG: Clp protease N-terminal domain-containing protein [Actinophytocola sp.]|uniref:Clp protease N-terminal domain-containing protein n=1 Tax=Actinophytocola sp. TaxID=1872138 RepID=UPI003D6C38D0
MFERFTRQMRRVVLDAVEEAERDEAARVTGEHLLLALLRADTRSAAILASAGLTRQVLLDEFAAAHRRGGLTEADAAALGELGIDVAAVVDRIETVHGENALADARPRRSWFPMGHIPFADPAKSLLEATLRQARERHERHIGDEHLLLAISAGAGVPAQILADHGLSYPEVRARLAKAS